MSTLENIAISTKIKGILILDERIDSGGIDVDTLGQGEVHLRGKVPNNVQAKLAEDLARLNGAHTVVNELAYAETITVSAEVAPAAAGVFGHVTTPEGAPSTGLPPLEMRIKDALAADSRVNAHLLKVEALEDGLIALSGRQGTVQQRDAAMEVARSVEGVSAVADEIEIQPAY
jgi:osmotically-inducible protein OsmY